MANLVRNLFKHQREYLRSSYRLMQSDTIKKREDISTQKDNSDLPIKLKENPFTEEKKVCILCRLNIVPDYKNVRLLSQFQSSYTGRIYGRHITGLCKAKQDKLEGEILKAQNTGLMPIYHKKAEYLRDPKLFDPDHPFRPHKY